MAVGAIMTKHFYDGDAADSCDPLLGSVMQERLIPERPWTWSIPVVRIRSYSIRLHVTLLAFVVLQILRTFLSSATGPLPSESAPMIVSLVALFWLVMIHDAAREFVSRRVGAEFSTLMLWPAGGISWRQPSDAWVNRLSAALAGPVALLLVGVCIAGTLFVRLGSWQNALLPSPLSLDGLSLFDSDRIGAILWLILWTDAMVLAASLLPMHPFAGGRIVASLLEVRFDFLRAQRISLIATMVLGILLAIVALASNALIVLLAATVAITTGMAGARGLMQSEFSSGFGQFAPRDEANRTDEDRRKKETRTAEKLRSEEAKVDAILRKIAQTGMSSLSWSERRLLKNATRRKRM